MNLLAHHLATSKEIPDNNLELVTIENETYFKIADSDYMRPFFMSIVSDSNHWLFISSNGALTAGRRNPEYALFPYYTDDKITESAEITGSKSIFQIHDGQALFIWEPFSEKFTGRYNINRNLYKSIFGNKILFEEINHDLGLVFQIKWQSSNLFGFVKQSSLRNISSKETTITLLDGVQNIMPFGVPSDLQAQSSNLVDAYKRCELIKDSGLGIFALSAIIVDKAEPSEALKGNIAWSMGLEHPLYLLSSLQLGKFRGGGALTEEKDIKGEKGAYFVSTALTLKPDENKDWKIVLNVNQTQSQVIALSYKIVHDKTLGQQVKHDIDLGTANLVKLNNTADGIQHTADVLQDARHFSNTLFNIMRGGIFDHNYQIEKNDLINYLNKANFQVFNEHKPFLDSLESLIDYPGLKEKVWQKGDTDLIRLCTEYLPLKFSRRHGDPSRPWNKFSINTRSEIDGSKILDYQGNWRDIFQNWEALAHAYPEFVDGMIFKFLNASTFDGYNPYRVTKDGFDWETIEPDNPWSYIGYWGDHQVIYLLKFLEFSESYFPGKLKAVIDKDLFVYAAVPYLIKPFEEVIKNAKDTIHFDHEWDSRIRSDRDKKGSDGALLYLKNGSIHKVNFLEKILALTLAKLSNFIPNGGIWMNTQRPEWNDANNALVGNGVSMVTLYYLRRLINFLQNLLAETNFKTVQVSAEMALLFEKMQLIFQEIAPVISRGINPKEQKSFITQSGIAASDFRMQIYQNGFSGSKRPIDLNELKAFFKCCLSLTDQSIKANKRSDHLYHSYNLVTFSEDSLEITHLSEMLEGQVSVLSSGLLTSAEALSVLDALKKSALYRPDQESYILYPNKELPGFLEKNTISPSLAESSLLLMTLNAEGNSEIAERDILGNFHFNGNFKNVNDLSDALKTLADKGYHKLVAEHGAVVLEIYEKVFNHKAFTGRSGTFFAYEGLGSIYWHMVSKLLLAVQECYQKAKNEQADSSVTQSLQKHFEEIKNGIGVHKSPSKYGAFPTDPYSHTPQHRGAQQPGMTGQVKEDILIRKNELGLQVCNGEIHFKPTQISKNDFLQETKTVKYYELNGEVSTVQLEADCLFFLYCQIPVIYQLAEKNKLQVTLKDGTVIESAMPVLPRDLSHKVFGRTGDVVRMHFQFKFS
jgi:hypothetical protein